MLGEIIQIDEGGQLFLSGCIEDWKPIHDRGITVVIDLEGDVDPDVPVMANEFLYVYLPIHDDALPPLRRLDAVARMGGHLIGRGERVLVHCAMGFNRSALVAGLILVQTGMSGADAVELLRSRRPGALFNKAFAEFLVAAAGGVSERV